MRSQQPKKIKKIENLNSSRPLSYKVPEMSENL